MSSERTRRIDDVFVEARDLAEGERTTFLDRQCAGDPELRGEVEDLLDQVAKVEQLFARRRLGMREPLPQTIGPYRVLAQIGEGGMGKVYLCEQADPRRRVAVKVMRSDRSGADVLARFEQERQALAIMDHPSVARIFGAGTTAEGWPYFVMEYVDGEPITVFAQRRALDLAARLRLFVQVCHAIQHAHQKGVVHRDIKPGNVLVTLVDDQPVPKVIDFGIAKAIDRPLTAAPLVTSDGQIFGTPAYMSPEQAAGADVDTRTDIYALGVTLYELLTSRHPFEQSELRSVVFDELRRIIREVDPPTPSARVEGLLASTSRGSIAMQRRRAELKTRARQLRGDLDWIVMTALDKERQRRYPSATELAADIERYLDDLPVLAGPPSRLYRVRKFARRHRAGVATGFVVALALVAGALVAAAEATRARAAEAEALAHAAQARRAEYRAGVSAAVLAIELGNPGLAARHLAEAPAELRGWEWRHLRARLDGSHAVLPLGEPVLALALDGSAHWLAAATGRVALWDASSLEPLPALADAPAPAERVAAGRGGRLAAAGERRVVVWDVPRRETLATLECKDHVRRLAFAADGAAVAIGLQSGAVLRLDVDARALAWEVAAAGGGVVDMAFDPLGRWLAVVADDGSASLRAAATGELVASLREASAALTAVAFGPTGGALVTGAADGAVTRWELGEQDGVPVASASNRRREHTARVFAVTYDASGTRIASASVDRTVRVWSADPSALPAVLRGHTDTVYACAFVDDGARLVSASKDGTLRVWRLAHAGYRSSAAIESGTGAFTSAVFSRSDPWIVAAASGGPPRVWSADTGELVGALATGPSDPVSIDTSPDGARAAVGHLDGSIAIVDLRTRALVRRIDAHGDVVRRIAFARGGSLLVSASASLRVWDALDGDALAAVEQAHEGVVRALAVAGERVATGGHDGAVRLWTLPALTPARVLPTDGRSVHALAFDAAGRTLAAGTYAGTIHLWDADTGAALGLLSTGELGDQAVFALAFTPDRTRLVSGHGDATLRVWDPEQGDLLLTLYRHTGSVHTLAFSPAGERFVSGGMDGVLRVADTLARRERFP